MSRTTKDGLVDMVAIDRFVTGGEVQLTAIEQRVAIHAARYAGRSIDWIATRLHIHDRKVKEELSRPVPTDGHRRPLVNPTRYQ